MITSPIDLLVSCPDSEDCDGVLARVTPDVARDILTAQKIIQDVRQAARETHPGSILSRIGRITLHDYPTNQLSAFGHFDALDDFEGFLDAEHSEVTGERPTIPADRLIRLDFRYLGVNETHFWWEIYLHDSIERIYSATVPVRVLEGRRVAAIA